MPGVGHLFRGSRTPAAAFVAALGRGLSENGSVDGRNVTMAYRFAEGQADRLPALAEDLVRQRVAAIAAPGGTATVLAAKIATAGVLETTVEPLEHGIPITGAH